MRFQGYNLFFNNNLVTNFCNKAIKWEVDFLIIILIMNIVRILID